MVPLPQTDTSALFFPRFSFLQTNRHVRRRVPWHVAAATRLLTGNGTPGSLVSPPRQPLQQEMYLATVLKNLVDSVTLRPLFDLKVNLAAFNIATA